MSEVASGIKPWLTWANGVWLVIYLATMGSIAYGLDYARRDSLDNMTTPAAQADWDAFRAEMTKQSKDEKAPVARRPPKSEEPPTLRLLRDYFGTCLSLALFLSSALFVTMMVMVRGVLGGEKFQPRAD